MPYSRTLRNKGWLKLRNQHDYYKRSGLYKLLSQKILTAVIIVLTLAGIWMLLHQFNADFTSRVHTAVSLLAPQWVLAVFFVSETLLGLIPPDIFIAWSSQSQVPWVMVLTLATLSYGAGLLAFQLGYWLRHHATLQPLLEKKFTRYSRFMNQWGGVMVVVAALFPLPFSTLAITAGLANYSFASFALWGLTRFLRFIIYAIPIFAIL